MISKNNSGYSGTIFSYYKNKIELKYINKE